MPTYECEKCSYKTTKKTNFDTHLNRINPCNPNKPNKNIKNNITFICESCNRNFASSDSLNKHNQTFHPRIQFNNKM